MAMVSSDQATPLVHAISGALGSASALLLLYPLERVRTEIQASAAIPSSSSSTPPIEIPTYQEKNNFRTGRSKTTTTMSYNS